MGFTFEENNKRTQNSVNCFLHDDASAGMQSPQTSITFALYMRIGSMETRLYTANATTTTQKPSDFTVEQSSFTLMALFWLKIGRYRGRNWFNENQA